MRRVHFLVAVALVLGACGAQVEETFDAVGSASPSPSASASPSPTDAATPTTGATDGPSTPATEDDGDRAEVAGTLAPSDLGHGLVSVDTRTGSLSWFGGLAWDTTDQADAVLDAFAFATDGAGGILVEDTNSIIWLYPEGSDEPRAVAEPFDELGAVLHLVGGGLVDGRPHAFAERGARPSPGTSRLDLVAIDVQDATERVLLEGSGGWESGVVGASVAGGWLVTTWGAEASSGVDAHSLDGSEPQVSVVDPVHDAIVLSALDVDDLEVPRAVALAPAQAFGGDLDDPGRFVVVDGLPNLGSHLDPVPVEVVGSALTAAWPWAVLSGQDGTFALDLRDDTWWRVDVDVAGVVLLAPGLAG